ncbi:zinc finger CCCH domain-containing protein 46 isoform X1 [Lactuca sativa]|uniref:zinc finger CCCH domain-containing protein 46 isoform X1 n=1 Tax=Lactuca sativa TaxID=4236 RepID=UPI000CD8CE49|nr:zinc finger CCCH domain-containing protein 46 isoform X1 [Lactuca sativa]XP_023753979.1 zinc finger CCCH domain-containing protein 46 isoform X1 [Lactuca sativa]
MPPPHKPLCRNFQRGFCKYGAECRFLHENQQQQAKPNPFGFGTGTQNTTQSPRTDPQPQKPNPFGFGVQNNSQTGSKPNQFKPGENKWSRFSPINAPNSSAPQKQNNQASAPNHVCTDSESCKRQISEDYEHETPLWKLTCYGHCKYGPCDIIGDISCEELRAAAYDDAKRGMNIQSVVEKERSLVNSKLTEFQNLLRNPYTPPQNSTLSTQNVFSGNTPQTIQNNTPPLVSSFSQLGTTVNSGFQMRPAAPNNIFGQVSHFQPPTQISNTPQKNPFAFGNPGAVVGPPSTQSFATTPTFGNALSSTATTASPNLNLPRQQSSTMPFGFGQNPSPNLLPEPLLTLQITQNIQISNDNGDNSIWFKEEWRPGEIPEEAPPEGVIC